MALKRKIDKAAFDKLSDVLKAEYKVSGSDANSYILDTDGDDDAAAAALRARDNEKRRADALQKEKDDSAAEQQRLKDEAARAKGDVTALEASWQGKLTAAEKAAKETNDRLTGQIKSLTVDQAARALASKISTAPDLLLPHIRPRLSLDMSGDTPITRVVDKDGKASALSLGDLEKELASDPAYKAIMIGSKASGGGAPRQPFAPGGARPGPTNPDGTAKPLARMTPQELAAHTRERIEAQKAAAES